MADLKPNLLFVMTDHQRADSLGMVQAGIEVTPNLNRLASQGTVFTRAYNTCPLCVPARTALATGKYPTSNGVVFNDWKGLRAREHRPIHQYLAEAGYQWDTSACITFGSSLGCGNACPLRVGSTIVITPSTWPTRESRNGRERAVMHFAET